MHTLVTQSRDKFVAKNRKLIPKIKCGLSLYTQNPTNGYTQFSPKVASFHLKMDSHSTTYLIRDN